MADFKSGLSYETLKAIADANAIDRLSKGSACKKRDKWQAVLSYQVADPSKPSGKRQVFVRRVLPDIKSAGRDAASKSKAEKLVSEWREQVKTDARRAARMAADPTSTVRECVEAFIEGKEKRGEIRGSTAQNYRYAARRIFGHPLASAPLQQLTTTTVQGWVDEMSEKLAGKTVHLSFNLLDAVCEKMLGAEHNPCAGVSLPSTEHNARSTSSRPNALTVSGVARLNSLLDELDRTAAENDETNILALAARLAIHTGMRAEEVCGLRWRDVDLANRIVSVTQVIQRAEEPKRDDSGEYIRDENGNIATTYTEYADKPKTKKSTRDIPMTDELADVLTTHRKRVESFIEKMEPNPRKQPDIAALYVLGDVAGGFLSPRALGKRWGKFAKKHDLLGTNGTVTTYHGLRHSAATRMVNAGVDIATVSNILGHAENSVTLNRYTTSDEESKRRAIDRMSSIFSARADGVVVPFDPDRTGTDN